MSPGTDNYFASHRRQVWTIALAKPRGSRATRVVLNLGFVSGAALVALTSAIHLHLWADGYRTVPVIGTLFLLQGLAGAVLSFALVGWRRMLTAVVGIGFMLTTIVGLLISVYFGLFGFMDSLAAPFAGMSLIVEIVGALALALVGTFVLAAALRLQRQDRSPTTQISDSEVCRRHSVTLGGSRPDDALHG